MRVVIAEDLALLRDGLTRLLESNDCTVVAAVDNGHALISAIEEHRPDVSVVDVRLPPTFRSRYKSSRRRPHERQRDSPPWRSTASLD